MWTAAQSPVRIGPVHAEAVSAGPASDDGAAVTQLFEVKVPLVLAAGGFLFVALGEVLLSVWRPRRPGSSEVRQPERGGVTPQPGQPRPPVDHPQ
jgi:hypothetical protein